MSYWSQISGLIVVSGFFDIKIINKNSPFGSEGGLDFTINSSITNDYGTSYSNKHPQGKSYLKSEMFTNISFSGNLRDFESDKIVRVEKWLNGIAQYFTKLSDTNKYKYFNDGKDYHPEKLMPILCDVNIRVYNRDLLVHFYLDESFKDNTTIYEIYKREIIEKEII
jgi:hypothetical protein